MISNLYITYIAHSPDTSSWSRYMYVLYTDLGEAPCSLHSHFVVELWVEDGLSQEVSTGGGRVCLQSLDSL